MINVLKINCGPSNLNKYVFNAVEKKGRKWLCQKVLLSNHIRLPMYYGKLNMVSEYGKIKLAFPQSILLYMCIKRYIFMVKYSKE